MADKMRKQFVEPALIKCVKRLDEVTMCFNHYGDNGCPGGPGGPGGPGRPGRPGRPR